MGGGFLAGGGSGLRSGGASGAENGFGRRGGRGGHGARRFDDSASGRGGGLRRRIGWRGLVGGGLFGGGLLNVFQLFFEKEPGAPGGGLLAADGFPGGVLDEAELGLGGRALVFVGETEAVAIEHGLVAGQVGLDVRELIEEELFVRHAFLLFYCASFIAIKSIALFDYLGTCIRQRHLLQIVA